MRKLLILSMVCFALVMPKAFGWELNWYNNEQYLDNTGLPVAPGGLVQLISMGPDGVINDPYEWWMSQADPTAAMQAWIAGGALPVGDDFLVVSGDAPNPNYILDLSEGGIYPPEEAWGWFSAMYITGLASYRPDQYGLYTRFFTAENPGECDWYGNVTTWMDLAGNIYDEPYHFTNDLYPNFPTMGGQVTQHIEAGIIPEPASASMLLGGIGLLLAFFRRKK